MVLVQQITWHVKPVEAKLRILDLLRAVALIDVHVF